MLYMRLGGSIGGRCDSFRSIIIVTNVGAGTHRIAEGASFEAPVSCNINTTVPSTFFRPSSQTPFSPFYPQRDFSPTTNETVHRRGSHLTDFDAPVMEPPTDSGP